MILGVMMMYLFGVFEFCGMFFVGFAFEVYVGMIIGEYIRENDFEVNLMKEKKLINMCVSGNDEMI